MSLFWKLRNTRKEPSKKKEYLYPPNTLHTDTTKPMIPTSEMAQEVVEEGDNKMTNSWCVPIETPDILKSKRKQKNKKCTLIC